ncbi:helix-turn-helix domain-containing protein [Vibrio sp. M250220]
MPELRFALVETLLLHTRGNQAHAARMLGISRCTLRKIYNQHHK